MNQLELVAKQLTEVRRKSVGCAIGDSQRLSLCTTRCWDTEKFCTGINNEPTCEWWLAMAIVRHYGVVLLKEGQIPMIVQPADTRGRAINSYGCSSLGCDYANAHNLLQNMRAQNKEGHYELLMFVWDDGT